MISDERRKEIISHLGTFDNAHEYLNMIERTIVHVHRRNDMGPAKATALKLLRDILMGYVDLLNDRVMDFSDDLARFSEMKKRAMDYWRQVDVAPADIHTHQILVPGAELILEEEESHEYKIMDQTASAGRMIALEVKDEDKDEEAS